MSKNSRPITPTEVETHKKTTFPPLVYKAFNELISKSYNPKTERAVVLQKTVVDLIVEYSKDEDKDEHLTKEDVYKDNLLDIEFAYREAGWGVNHEKASMGEDFESYFEFTKRT